MDEEEFWRLLNLFPVVRTRDYCAELDSPRHSTSSSASNKAGSSAAGKEMENQEINLHDEFWQKLKLAAEKKVGAAEADKFCKAFQRVHQKLVYEGLSPDAAQKLLHL